MNFDLEHFSKEQLLLLNELVQVQPLSKRLSYLQEMGDIYSYIQESKAYFIDNRDYNIYSVIRIANQEWLGENLRYKGVPHYENPNNPNLFYGYLYDWATVMNLPKRFIKELWEEESSKHQGIAPEGWHIPNSSEWEIWEEQFFGGKLVNTIRKKLIIANFKTIGLY